MEITKFRSQLSSGLEQLTVHLRQKQRKLTQLGRGSSETRRLGETLRARENGLGQLQAWFLSAIVATKGKISKFRSQTSIVVKYMTGHLERACHTVMRLGRSIVEKPRALRGTLRARENELRNLLATSTDAIVVTNSSHRFIATNPKALDLFGVSERNIAKFTIDVFFPYDQLLRFDRNGSRSMRGHEKHGKCKIRRLDGSLRVAEYVFVAHFIPRRHLFKFIDITQRNGRMQTIAQFNQTHD